MANCADNSYIIYYTNLERGTIQIIKSALIQDELDIALIGKTRLEYGEIFNENLLHLLERFACPEDPSDPGTPDLASAYGTLLENPTAGQIWYNKSQEKPFIYSTADTWVSIASLSDASGNSGVMQDGATMPFPYKENGDQFTAAECAWTVSPFFIGSEFDYVVCYADALGVIHSKYRTLGNTAIQSGWANFQIIGITDNNSIGVIGCSEAPVPTPTPGVPVTPTPTPTSP